MGANQSITTQVYQRYVPPTDTQDAFQTIFDFQDIRALSGTVAIHNVGAVNKGFMQVTVEGPFGQSNVITGDSDPTKVDKLPIDGIGVAPVRRLKVEIQSKVPGMPTQYEAILTALH